jgi:hypothetical protein
VLASTRRSPQSEPVSKPESTASRREATVRPSHRRGQTPD